MLTTFTVTSPLDTGPNVTGELRWAVNQANSNPGMDDVVFQVNDISLNLGEIGITDDVQLNMLSTTVTPVTIVNSGANRIFNIDDNNVLNMIDVSMSNMALEGGDTTDQGGAILNRENLELRRSAIRGNNADEGGGGIYNEDGAVRMIGGTIRGNTASTIPMTILGGGGGILSEGANASVVLTEVVVFGNTLDMGIGGGIFNNGGTLLVNGSTIAENVVNDAGAGIATDGGGTTTIRNSEIRMNVAGFAAGGLSAGTNSELTVTNSTVAFNGAQFGGGMVIAGDSTATIDAQSLISSNVATVEGGGILTLESTLRMEDTRVQGNQAGSLAAGGRGGGILLSQSSEATIHNSQIDGNGETIDGSQTERGGGIYAGQSVQLTITDSRIADNVAEFGGGIYANPVDDPGNTTAPRVTVEISDTSFSQNVAFQTGGAIYVGGYVDISLKCADVANNSAQRGGGMYLTGESGIFNTTARIADSRFTENTARTRGGAVLSEGGVAMEISNSILSNNSAGLRGGGLHLEETIGTDNETVIDLSLVSGNTAMDVDAVPMEQRGGGIFVGNRASLRMNRTTIENNTSRNQGGGIAAVSAESLNLRNSTVTGNTSNNGGGLAIVESPTEVFQSTFYDNRAQRTGGGIMIDSSLSDPIVIAHSTISGNSISPVALARGGGGIVLTSSLDFGPALLELTHTIVSGNTGSTITGFDEILDSAMVAGSSSISAAYSLVRDGVGTALVPGNPDPATGNFIGTLGTPIDAQLMPLGSNGGPTQTMLPMDSSPALDGGSLTIPTNIYDQRTLPFKRIFGPRVDIGAVEVQPPPPTPDFDMDGDADCTDVDALVSVIVAGSNNPIYDLTGDGVVNQADLNKWLDDAPDVNGDPIARYLRGDGNLDGFVDISDFNIWNANKFTTGSGFCGGDYNADGVTDISDFNIWNARKFTASPPITIGCGLFTDGTGSGAFVTAGDNLGDQPSADDTLLPLDPPANTMRTVATATLRSKVAAGEEDSSEKLFATLSDMIFADLGGGKV